MLWGLWDTFPCFGWCELYTALCRHRAGQEGSQEATHPRVLGHWPHTCRSWELFFQHTAASKDEDSADSPGNLLQCFATLRVIKLFLLCNLNLACCNLNTSLCLLSLGEVKNSLFLFCLWKPLSCMRIFMTSLLSPSFLSTNQLQAFSESSQPIQTNIVLQWMWLHTTEHKKHLFCSYDLNYQSHFPSLCLKHLSYCLCVWVINSELNRNAFTFSFLKFESGRNAVDHFTA